ncbi:hypothetical protein TNIN_44381 [Trichonephila inaurata madagascariensis]|uniref:Uncharacterized protein n=1 Tax=Trichonephila inaurata madagascariensis TaxID=2747483 RepID=A0A8X6XI46_9ARAC|nr:hypothetical protein TNIN_44381 [Trichonephila inaurata madagascariensis]
MQKIRDNSDVNKLCSSFTRIENAMLKKSIAVDIPPLLFILFSATTNCLRTSSRQNVRAAVTGHWPLSNVYGQAKDDR